MPTFVSKDPQHEIAHPTLAEAAGSDFFTVRFRPQGAEGVFKTDSEPLATALDALIEGGNVRGVMRLDADAPSQRDEAPAEGTPEPSPAEETTDVATTPRRGQRG